MRIILNSLFFALLMSLGISSCETETTNSPETNKTENQMETTTIMEVTTFGINKDVDAVAFSNRDAQVESDFTSAQPGFIKRQSGVDDKGNYVVVVYWESLTDADASMKKFMGDTSVADYAQMIDGPTMKMDRYTMDVAFNASTSQFVEIMSFNITSEIDAEKFSKLNHKVETAFTGQREGFLQRLTGVDENGKQVVAVYWESKETSDASLQPFMDSKIAKKFMDKIDQSSMSMGRYKFLK